MFLTFKMILGFFAPLAVTCVGFLAKVGTAWKN